MRNKLTLANSFFVLLAVGKMAGIGTLASFPWWRVFAFLGVDWAVDFLHWLANYYGMLGRIIMMEKRVRAKYKVNKIANRLKSQERP